MNLIDEVLRREDLERRFKDTGLTTKEVEALFRLRRNDYFSVSLKLARAFDRLKKEVVHMSYDKHRKTEVEILEMLAEIEKELTNG